MFDKEIPPPVKRVTKVNTLLSMEIGDSFVVSRADAGSWRCAMSKAAEVERSHFVSRSEASGVRIWRDG